MAPFLISADPIKMLGTGLNELQQRGLGNSTTPVPDLSIRKQSNLQILAVTFSSISVASAILSFYWFVQMRRSFRHHLIMLLIQSDMFKALWFLIYPIVVFTYGPQASTSTFCQVNGFFISLGIEASDFAILMIAIHTALYIFRPVAAAGEGGLYPYRRIAYALWVILPVLAASLAFINGSDKGYASQATYCYLPIRPFWFRLALSWIPRYAIFVFIFLIYATIYFYVRYNLNNFNRDSSNDSNVSKIDDRNSIRRAKKWKQYGLPATPPLAYNGLIPESRTNSFSEHRAAKPSISTLNSEPESSFGNTTDTRSNSYIEAHAISYQDHLVEASTGIPCAGSSCNTTPQNGEESTTAASSPTAARSSEDNQAILKHGEPISPRPFSTASTLIYKNSSFKDFFNRRFSPPTSTPSSNNQRSLIPMRAGLRHPDSTPTTTGVVNLDLLDTQGQNVTTSELAKTRDKIRKQLRFLFIYPLFYIAMWLVPFVSHVLQYSDKLALNPPYALSCVTVVFITLQCAVDCWLFSTRERPWRHMPNNPEGTFWGSFNLWRVGAKATVPGHKVKSGPGKSRAEQIAEARLAYKRREEEAEAWKRIDLERRRKLEEEREWGQMERNWWDGVGVMSPVVEELDPMELAHMNPHDSTYSEGRTSFTLQRQSGDHTIRDDDSAKHVEGIDGFKNRDEG